MCNVCSRKAKTKRMSPSLCYVFYLVFYQRVSVSLLSGSFSRLSSIRCRMHIKWLWFGAVHCHSGEYTRHSIPNAVDRGNDWIVNDASPIKKTRRLTFANEKSNKRHKLERYFVIVYALVSTHLCTGHCSVYAAVHVPVNEYIVWQGLFWSRAFPLNFSCRRAHFG